MGHHGQIWPKVLALITKRLAHLGRAEWPLSFLQCAVIAELVHDAGLLNRVKRHAGLTVETSRSALALSDIDRRRKTYIEQMLVEAGIALPLAATRAQLLYWTYLGVTLSRSNLSGKRPRSDRG